jgi:glutathione synthase/RimK-type ligase-like ATP-grasp enzyme
MVHAAAPAAAARDEGLETVLFYTVGQSLGGRNQDEQIIARAFRERGLITSIVDLSNVHQAADGQLLLADAATGAMTPWRDPHSALMYHGAIAPDGAMEKLAAMQARGTRVVNGPESWPVFTDKHLFAEYGRERGINVIPTTLATTEDELRAAVQANGGEAIIKKPISTEGDDIFLVRSGAELDDLAQRLPKLGDRVIVQPLVDSRIGDDIESGIAAKLVPEEFGRRHEFRVNTARMPSGDVSVDAVYVRVAPDETQVVNNVAQGARAVAINFADLHPADQETILHAARSMPDGGDIVGWDLIGQPGRRMVIEGNSGSGLPTGREGADPNAIARSYAQIMESAALESGVAGTGVRGAR